MTVETSSGININDIDLRGYSAILFDLDGVITPTALIHEQAWGDMFRQYFSDKGVAPYTDADYFEYLDGRRRDQGIQAILASRGIELPYGSESDTPDDETVTGLGLRKNNDFLSRVEQGIDPYTGSVQLLDYLAAARAGLSEPGEPSSGLPHLAVVSSSKNAVPVLKSAGLFNRFEIVVDGKVAHELGLNGKPSPATFVHAAEEFGVPVERSVVVEDAISGVQAGAAGDFGLVIGVDRGAGHDELLAAGAHIVVDDLAELIAH